jgi:hypothetical protein
MFSALAKFLLVLSAIAPVGLVYAWVMFREGQSSIALGILTGSVVLIVCCAVLLSKAKKLLERFSFKLSTVEAADRENIAFMLLYLSPLFTSEFGQLNFDLLIPTLIIFALMTATGYNYHFNPLLGLIGWHFYKVSSAEGVSYVLLTKKKIYNTSQISNVGQLTDYILIDLG